MLLFGFSKHETVKCSYFVTNSSTVPSTEHYSILHNTLTMQWEEAAVGVLAPGDLLRVFGHFLSAAELIRVIMRVIMTGAWSLSPDNRGGSF